MKIHTDHARFKEIVKGKIKDNLRKYIQKGEMIGKQGKDRISIPIPSIDLPHFRFGSRQQGVGQGPGDVGDPLSPGDQDPNGKAGKDEGSHSLEVDISIDELAEMLGEELALPRIEPKSSRQIDSEKTKYTGISPQGPEGLRHFKRTYKQALRRQIASGNYNGDIPIVIPRKEDKRYRSGKIVEQPQSSAAIIYMMDVSGSMGDQQKEIVRITSFWLDTWLRAHYKGVASRYIIHDVVAREVDKETFFHTQESGGTMISSAYKLANEIIKKDYDSSSWNVYAFHFSDGDNYSVDDTQECIALLKTELLLRLNQFAYGQVESAYGGSGEVLKHYMEALGHDERVALSAIADKEAVYDSIKAFLGKGN